MVKHVKCVLTQICTLYMVKGSKIFFPMSICELGLTLPCGNLKLDEGYMLTERDIEVNLGVLSLSSGLPSDLLILSLLEFTTTPFLFVLLCFR